MYVVMISGAFDPDFWEAEGRGGGNREKNDPTQLNVESSKRRGCYNPNPIHLLKTATFLWFSTTCES